MAVLPQQFGALKPGRRYAAAVGTVSATADLIFTETTIYETVGVGGLAKLPRSGASSVYCRVLNRCGTGQALGIIPDDGGQIETVGVNVPVYIVDGGNATFLCFDQVIAPGYQWWIV